VTVGELLLLVRKQAVIARGVATHCTPLRLWHRHCDDGFVDPRLLGRELTGRAGIAGERRSIFDAADDGCQGPG